MTSVIALVTAREARGLDEDLPPLEAALHAAGLETRVVDWDDPEASWASFDLALLRSTWDYTDRLREFLVWVDAAGSLTRLLNAPRVVRWNTDKHYLSELARAGVPVIPSTFIEPGENPERALGAFLASHTAAEFVVKPSVGAGSRDAQRHVRTQVGPALTQAQRLLDAERSVLLQPYLESVDTDGETALMFFDGRFSHAIRKGPLLPRGSTASPAVGLFAPEKVTSRTPGADELRVAEQVLAALPFEAPLYARVDLIRDSQGAPTLLEIELTEPSLFFAHASGAAERFAAEVVKRATA
jgi:glutathione synthase/RimK-type ligase-like ATP-grasp enzyme